MRTSTLREKRRSGGIVTLLAVIGMFVLSSGFALLATAGSANAASSEQRGDKDCNQVVSKKDRDRCGDDCDGDVRKQDASKKDRDRCGDDCEWDVPNKVDAKKDRNCGNECDDITFSKSDGKKGDWCGNECDELLKSDGKKGDWCGNECDAEVMDKSTGDRGNWCDEPCDIDVAKAGGQYFELCEVTPGAPTFTDPTCDTDPSMALPEGHPVPVKDMRTAADPVVEDIDGVRYTVTGDVAPGGTVVVEAEALKGYEIPETATTTWEHTFSTPTDCETVVVDPPTEVVEGVVSPEVVTPTLVSAGAVPTVTGDQTAAQGLIGAGLALLLGAGVLSLVRRTSAAA